MNTYSVRLGPIHSAVLANTHSGVLSGQKTSQKGIAAHYATDVKKGKEREAYRETLLKTKN
jgi:hypothetical protein